MSQLSSVQLQIGALTNAVCDLLANERLNFDAILRLLERKGVVSSAELHEAIQSTSELAPESVAEEIRIVANDMRERVMVRLPIGPAQ